MRIGSPWFSFAMIAGAFLLVWLQARQTAHPSRAAQSRYRGRNAPIVIPRELGRLERRRMGKRGRQRRGRLLGRRWRFRRGRLVGQLVGSGRSGFHYRRRPQAGGRRHRRGRGRHVRRDRRHHRAGQRPLPARAGAVGGADRARPALPLHHLDVVAHPAHLRAADRGVCGSGAVAPAPRASAWPWCRPR